MNVKVLTEHHLELLSLKGDCTGSSESTLVKIAHCWKSHVAAYFLFDDCIRAYISDSFTFNVAVPFKVAL